ncbi:von willebrand factor type D domain-containing protein [Phthorimaea operculella]|nr:von willebrand factor type D domain-containing protein [Phthorimaea operculella]
MIRRTANPRRKLSCPPNRLWSPLKWQLWLLRRPPQSLLLRHSKLSLPLEKWCDGLQDCPDNEKDCKPKEEIVMSTEPTVVTTQVATVAVTQTTTVVTTEKRLQDCPDDKKDCKPKEEIVMSTEPTVVTTQVATVAVTQTTTVVTTEKRLQDCPDDEKDCKPREEIVMTTEPTVVTTQVATVVVTQTTTVAITEKRKYSYVDMRIHRNEYQNQSKLCLPLERWCDGLQDCPDDEKDCKPKEEIVMSTEPTVVTTQVATVAVTQKTTVVTTEKPQECPKVECPPGYFVRYVSTTSSYSRTTSDLPPPRPRNSYSRYTKGGYSKGGYSKGGYSKGGYSKGGYSKGGYSKGGGTKGGYTPLPLPPTTQQPQTNPSNTTQECAQFKCIPNLPPPFKPGSTKPVVCSSPACPNNYVLKLDSVPLEPHQCPQYICVPPPERYAYCNMTGRTFHTFDGAEYKFDVCFHILARDSRFNAWSVLVRKICTLDGCVNQLMVQQDSDIILIKPNLMIQYNNYEYTVEQTSKICFQKNSFDVNKIGNGLVIKSRRYDFSVLYTTDGNVKVAVNTKYKYMVDGLCGYYDGDEYNERRKPDGTFATSIDEFAEGWAKPGLRPDACEIKIIPPEKQQKAWDLCEVIIKEPISQCSKVLNLDKWRSICLEKVCECTDLVINGSKKSYEECRCSFLDTLVAQCLAADKDVDLGDWRMQMDCPAECPAPLVHYDCYRRRCEPTCSTIGDPRRSCPVEDGQCFPGCYCPDGKLRKGDTCVTPQDCLDCVCSGVGTPAKYVSFEGDDVPDLGNCTYLASRDRNESGLHTYEVYASNGPCEDNSKSTCVKAIHLIYEKNIVHVTKDDVSKKLITTVNKVPVFKFPMTNDWITVSQINAQDISLLLPDAHVEVKVLQAKMEFSVNVPAYLYANQTEGLCGVCAGYLDQLVTSNGTVADNFEQYGKSWQATPTMLTTLDIPPQEQCGDIPPPPECKLPPPDKNPCYNLMNADRFGQCHALLDPQSYLEACEEELCTQNTTNACPSLERYAAECGRAGICLDWRDGLCPYPHPCVAPMVYMPCKQCEKTCDNYEEIPYTLKCYAQPPREGCFCPEGKVRVNNTCIEPSKCFPCDAEKKHYAGDEWQEDACTSCTCNKMADENKAHVSCTVQTCSKPLCKEDEDLITQPAKPGACCPTYLCVSLPKQAQCVEPKHIECGYGQLLKQKTSADGCPQLACECVPASECEHIPSSSEVEMIEPGMERVIDNSGCCPRALMLCKPETCPEAPDCPQYHDLVTSNATGKCCPTYDCEAPKDKCIVSLEWEATPKGGEKRKDNPQRVLKEVEATWIDGPCRYCTCQRTPLGPATSCSTSECPPIVATEQFVLEPKPVPFQCCPDALYVACRDGDNIYRVNETWTSSDNVCESYQCLQTGDNKLEKVTTVQNCHTDCDAGWQYFPAEAGSDKCCGKCKPVACVCEGVEHRIGEKWASPDHCTLYTCVDTNGTVQVEMTTEKCPEVSAEMKKQFVLEEKEVSGNCCKIHEPVACKVGDKIYQENETWPTSDPCVNLTCARDAAGQLTRRESVETCVRDCQPGYAYKPPADGNTCCGHCVQDACKVEDKFIKPGTTWYSADNCTKYKCDKDGDSVSISITVPSCPDISHCEPENIVNETCCQVCREKPQAQSTCVPTPLGLESVGVVRVHLHGRGLCVNTKPVPDFKECRGTCDSGTVYNNQTGVHDSKCECCQSLEYGHVIVKLTCEDGTTRRHQVASPTRCGCRSCGASAGQVWPWDHTTGRTAETEADEIPEIYQRFGSSKMPRKY